MTQTTSEPTGQLANHRGSIKGKGYVILAICVSVLLAAVVVARTMLSGSTPATGSSSSELVRYLGVSERDAPGSYAGIDQFAHAIGRQPNIVVYYASWLEQFQVGFATSAARRGAIPLVQIGTGSISLASIANGQYDTYLRSYADEVKAFGHQTILSLDHEMNGDWYSWGYRHTSPATFVAAWRHVVGIFREQGVRNVTWLWTVNVSDSLDRNIPGPAPWFPGSAFVNWVGIDGYFYGYSETFASLFGPTIADVREITHAPILIAETASTLSAGQPGKIAELFSGIRRYQLLGFVLFDQNGVLGNVETWHISSPAAYAALRQGAKAYMKPAP